jgi:pimeloyl-ACP methyl ester carboxylesterase
MRTPLLKLAAVGLAVAVIAYVAVVALLYFNQEKLIFAGSRLPSNYRFSFPAQRFEEIRVHVPVAGQGQAAQGGQAGQAGRGDENRATLHALHFMQPAPRGLVFFLHGNGGDLSTWTTGVDFYERNRYDLFIFDYRGYGLSTGHIESEAQLHADVRAMWNTIAPGYRERKLPIVIYGRSLGAALATPLARDENPAMLVLVTPFTSLVSMATRIYPFVPKGLIRYPLRTDAAIADVKSPVVLVHGTRDTLVPFDDSVALLKLAPPGTELIKIDGAGHNDIHDYREYLDALSARLERVAAR